MWFWAQLLNLFHQIGAFPPYTGKQFHTISFAQYLCVCNFRLCSNLFYRFYQRLEFQVAHTPEQSNAIQCAWLLHFITFVHKTRFCPIFIVVFLPSSRYNYNIRWMCVSLYSARYTNFDILYFRSDTEHYVPHGIPWTAKDSPFHLLTVPSSSFPRVAFRLRLEKYISLLATIIPSFLISNAKLWHRNAPDIEN